MSNPPLPAAAGALTAPGILVALALALGLAGGRAPKDAPPPPVAERRIAPDLATMGPPYQVVGNAIELTVRGVRVRVEPLDEARREAFFRLRTSLGSDPIPRGRGYPVFEISIQDASGRQVTFDPALVTCRFGDDVEVRKLQFDQIFALLRVRREGDPNPEQGAVADLKAFHVEPLMLEDGQRVTKLQVFERLPARARRLTLDLDHLFVGTEEVHPRFDFVVQGMPASRD